MNIGAISDLHGNLINIEPCELLLIGGDISPLFIQRDILKMERWIDEEFIPWCNRIPCEKIILIAGNHDYIFSKASDVIKHHLSEKSDGKIVYLENSEYNYLSKEGKVYKIFGTPWCHQFGSWPFMLSDYALREKFNLIPRDCDIILSHDCPYGTGDQCLQLNDLHRGSVPLADAITNCQPNYLLTGHLHTANHQCEMLGNTKIYNVSIVDEKYEIFNNGLYLSI